MISPQEQIQEDAPPLTPEEAAAKRAEMLAAARKSAFAFANSSASALLQRGFGQAVEISSIFTRRNKIVNGLVLPLSDEDNSRRSWAVVVAREVSFCGFVDKTTDDGVPKFKRRPVPLSIERIPLDGSDYIDAELQRMIGIVAESACFYQNRETPPQMEVALVQQQDEVTALPLVA